MDVIMMLLIVIFWVFCYGLIYFFDLLAGS